MKNKFDWFLMILFLANMVGSLLNKSYSETMAWACAAMTLGRILTQNIVNDEEI